MEMESISRETLGPFAPTPPHLRVRPLSMLDNFTHTSCVPLIYFYPNQPIEYDDTNNNDASSNQVCDKISMLKKSLSKVLSLYYPLAGRLKDKFIECNDQGVLLIVTRTNCNLSTILQNPIETLLNPLFPDELPRKDMGSSASLLAIQINFFACGGIAIGVCMSHKVGDISTLSNFVNDWAALNRNSSKEEGELIIPLVDAGASIFPQGDLPVLPPIKFVEPNNTVMSRFVFEGPKIEFLKAMVLSSNKLVENPTRVQVIIALLYKHLVSALGLNPKNKPCRIIINLRKRMVPPLPEKSIGNFVWSFFPSNQFIDRKLPLELHDLVREIKEGLDEFCDKKIKNFGAEMSYAYEFLRKAHSLTQKNEAIASWDNNNEFTFTSWCSFSMYEADFGWGKPIWVTTSKRPMSNTIVFMDTSDGKGIEALVNLEEKDMALFECDKDLFQYVSFSPNRWTC